MKSAIPRLDLTIVQGKTFEKVIRWETEPYIYVPIASITQAAPAAVECQVPHGMPDGWRAALVSAKGMRQINAENKPPKDRDFHRATVIDETTVEFNDINAADFSEHTPSTGYLQFFTPKSLAGRTARMTIKAPDGTELLSLTTENNRIVLDDDAKTIAVRVSATDAAALTWTRGLYDLEVEDGDGNVDGLYQGNVTVEREETT